MLNPDFTDSIVEEILEDLSLKEKHIIAHMDDISIEILEAIVDRYVEGKGSQVNDGKDVVKRIWAKLYESNRLKVVK